jgi:ribosomal protein S18 acetylase RimI-like enzyme
MPELKINGVETFVARLPELVDVYRRAFLDVYETNPDQATRERRALMQQHQYRSGLRLATVEEDDGTIIGFCYSYHGSPGHWWHDVVRRGLDNKARASWLGNCREIVELHVRPESQGLGLGRQLLRAALADAPESTAVLSALDRPDSPAIRLYTSEGFAPILERFRFPGSTTLYVIFGKHLTPQADPATSSS